MRLLRIAAVSGFILLTGASLSPASATTYTNANSPSKEVWSFVMDLPKSYVGLVFTAPGGTLSDFEFLVNGGNTGNYTLTIASWDPVRNVSTAESVWRSPILYYDGARESVGKTPIYIDLPKGKTYIAYVTNMFVGGSVEALWGVNLLYTESDNSGIAQGSAFTFSQGHPVDTLVPWLVSQPGNALKFRATFAPSTAVPEPYQWGLSIAGLGVIGAFSRRRRSA